MASPSSFLSSPLSFLFFTCSFCFFSRAHLRSRTTGVAKRLPRLGVNIPHKLFGNLGCVVGSLTPIFLLHFPSSSPFLNHAPIWCFSLGYFLQYGAMFHECYHFVVEFNVMKALRSDQLPKFRWIGRIVVLVVFFLLPMIILALYSGLEPTCSSFDRVIDQIVFISLAVLAVILLLSVGTVAYLFSKRITGEFNEVRIKKSVFACIYTVAFSCLTTALLPFWDAVDDQTIYWVRFATIGVIFPFINTFMTRKIIISMFTCGYFREIEGNQPSRSRIPRPKPNSKTHSISTTQSISATLFHPELEQANEGKISEVESV